MNAPPRLPAGVDAGHEMETSSGHLGDCWATQPDPRPANPNYAHPCRQPAETTLGLCPHHHAEIVGQPIP